MPIDVTPALTLKTAVQDLKDELRSTIEIAVTKFYQTTGLVPAHVDVFISETGHFVADVRIRLEP